MERYLITFIQIDINKLSVLKTWKPQYTLEVILTAILNEMKSNANKKLAQPNEGEMY